MSVDLVCPQCGHANRAVGVFCAQCGTKMGTPEIRRHAERRAAPGALGSLVRALVALAVLAGVVLLLWPVPVPSTSPDPAQVAGYLSKRGELEAGVRSGRMTAAVFTEEEINSFLSKRVADTAGAGEARGLRLALHTLHADLGEQGITYSVLAGYGPVRLSYQVTGRIVVGADRVLFPVDAARVGHLPFPGKTGDWVAAKALETLSGLQSERWIMEHVERCDLADGRLRLVTAAAVP